MDINAIATDILLAAESLKNVSLDTIREKYCEGENGRDTHLAALNAAVKFLHDFTEDPTTETETMAKAAAYDRVKQIAHEFVQRHTNGTRGILNEAGLTEHLRQMESAFEAAANTAGTPNTAVSPAQYITLLEQAVQQKDAEIAALRQQIQQKDSEIAQLKAAQTPVPTP